MWVGSKVENFVTWVGSLWTSSVRRMARLLISKTCREWRSVFRHMVWMLCVALAWTSPESSPATISLPSERIFALFAVSLNLAIVLTTFCVLGANICIRAPEVTAYWCGRQGEKWIEVTGRVSLMKTGFLKRLQYFDSGERLGVVRGWCFTTTG